jgi:hypothetical protein
MQSISSIPFVDGVTRPVYLDADGRQFVLDVDGTPIYGVWVLIDEPEFVIRESAKS